MKRALGRLALTIGLGSAALVVAARVAVLPEWRARRRRAPTPAATPVPAARRRAPGSLRVAALFTGWAAAGMAVTLLAVLGVSWLAGYRSLTVMSGSMEPAIATGDVVVNKRIAPLEARAGDVVTFRDPGDTGQLITHRVRAVRASGAQVTVVTKGDANSSTERWTVSESGEIGRVDYRVPRLGYALFWTGGRWAKLALVTVPSLLLGMLLLAGIWRPRADARAR
ncbi:MAG: signal peptidase I [Thermoleophilaceae bacterium]